MRVRNICVQNKVTKTITRTLCVLFFASALAQAKATDLIVADPSTWTDNLTSEKVDLINQIWKSTGNELSYSSVLPMALPEGITAVPGVAPSLKRAFEVKVQDAIPSAISATKPIFRQELADLTVKDLKNIRSHFESKYGKAMLRNIKAAVADPKELNMELARKLPRLITQTKKIEAVSLLIENHFQPALETQLEVVLKTGVVTLQAMAIWNTGKPISDDMIEKLNYQLKSQKAALFLQANQAIVYSTIFALRNVSSREVRKADKFLSTELGKKWIALQAEADTTYVTTLMETIYIQLEDEANKLASKRDGVTPDVSLGNSAGVCLATPNTLPFNGLNMVQQICDGTAAQWINVDSERLRNMEASTCFAPFFDSTVGKPEFVVQRDCDDADSSRFVEQKIDDEFFSIYHPATDRCIAIAGAPRSSGTPIRLVRCNQSSISQRFRRVVKQI